ncbi:MAG TPA: response regulator [Polyangiaceae bacterium]|jgi:DNA-binding response OmpR family regulator|nr:response regulator [Polyangiaceae bacterium]
MSSGADANASGEGRLGGARADFVASLGRKVSDTRGLLSVLDDDPSSKLARDELRRRLHALCSGARLLRFEAMAHSLQDALAVLDRAAQMGEFGEAEVAFTAQVLDDLPALAWSEGPSRNAAARGGGEAPAERRALPTTVLLVGAGAFADALGEGASAHGRTFECERTEDVEAALQLARAYAPDLVLVDGDFPRAADLVEALLDDPLTEPVPIVVVGSFRAAEESARFTALGVAKILRKPASGDKLRAACEEILESREERTQRITLGEPTLEQLAARLAEELKRALVDSVEPQGRAVRVPLGEGTEVFGAMWGAIARVQEIVTQRTGGAIRFGGDAPEGAIALAPWLHQEMPGADRMAGRGRGAAADVRMSGRRIVVADDDPGVTWFISDLLRTAGCEVFEALDGTAALELAYRMQPELVVSDILMPGLDGFALSRALRRDVALRDTPVILLSWKEDLLQRVRELGASAAAYMRKETDSRAILARVREVLRPRARIEMRIRGAAEVRGRLDELSPRLLLDLVCIVRKDARIAVRDASFLYEIDIRGGAPRKATRTASDGGYQSGERALASLLGVGAGRFVVSSTQDPVRGDLSGTLFDQLAGPIAAARGALAATTGAAAMQVERIGFDRPLLEEYLRATPDPARSIIKRIADGSSPRQMLLAGDVSPSLLEDVLADLAARGAIRTVDGTDGADLLTPAVQAALAVVRGHPPRSAPRLPPNARPSVPLPLAKVPPLAAASPEAPPVYETLQLSDAPPPMQPDEDSDPIPSSLEDAVMREISDRSPSPGAAHPSAPQLPPIVEPSELRPRSSNPPSLEDEGDLRREDDALLPSIPPDAVVPETVSADMPAAATSAADGPFVSPFAVPEAPREAARGGEPDARAAPVEGVGAKAGNPGTVTLESAKRVEGPGAAPKTPSSSEVSPATGAPGAPRVVIAPSSGPAARSPVAARPPSRRTPWGPIMAFVLLAAGAAAAIYFTGTGLDSSPAAPSATSPTAAAPSSTPVPPKPSTPPPAAARAESDEPPAGVQIPPGAGYLEVSAPTGANVRVDGVWAGAGPIASRVVAAGYHEVVVETGGRESKQVVEVRAAKATRVRSAAAP